MIKTSRGPKSPKVPLGEIDCFRRPACGQPIHRRLQTMDPFGLHQRRKRRPPTMNNARVLLAATDISLRAALSKEFRVDGCKVHELQDGLSLIAWLGDALLEDRELLLPDLIVTEAELPGCTGIHILRDLRNAGWRTPFVLLGRPSSAEHLREILEMGMAVLFEPPFDNDDLLTAAYFLLDRMMCFYPGPTTKPEPSA